MKKTVVSLLSLLLTALLLCGCASGASSAASVSSESPSAEASSALISSQTASEPAKNYNLVFRFNHSIAGANEWEIAAEGTDDRQPLFYNSACCAVWAEHGLTHGSWLNTAEAEYPGAETVKRWKLYYKIDNGDDAVTSGEVAGSFELNENVQLEVYLDEDGNAVGATSPFERCYACEVDGGYNTSLYVAGFENGGTTHWFVSAAGEQKWVCLDGYTKLACNGSAAHAPEGGDFFWGGDNVGLDHAPIYELSFFYPEKYKSGAWDFMAVSAVEDDNLTGFTAYMGVRIGNPVYVVKNIKLDENHWLALQRYNSSALVEEVRVLNYERGSCCLTEN